MRFILTFIAFLVLAAANFGCGGKPANSEQANANAATESPFVHITDAAVALAEGNRLLDENDTKMAIAAFKQAVTLDPDLAEAWFQLGIGHSLLEMQMARSGEVSSEPAANAKEGRIKTNSEKAFEKAVEAYKKLLKTNPDDDAAQFNLGRTYAKLNKDDEAEEAFRRAVKLKPDDTEYQTELGAILIKLAKYGEALDPLKKAVALDESNSRALDLLDDAEAGRQRLSYVAPKNANMSNANMSANANMGANSNSSSAAKPTNANTKPKTAEPKKPNTPGNKPK